MKKITWMEIGIAAPMVLTFAGLGGMQSVAIATAALGVLMAVLKWGTGIAITRPAVVKVEARN